MRLHLDTVTAGYGHGTTLHGISVQIAPGTVHAIVGHNGAGKTTLLHTIAGLVATTGGSIRYGDRDITAWPAHRRARAGIALVPQGRRVFPSLTVTEHLAIAYRPARTDAIAGWTPARVLELFPPLAARRSHRAADLSGGEQQLLAIARALLTQPQLLLLDEPTEGLAPVLAERIQHLVGEWARGGHTTLLASPHPRLPLAVAEHISVLSTGRLRRPLPASQLRTDARPLHEALSPASAAAGPPTRKEDHDER